MLIRGIISCNIYMTNNKGLFDEYGIYPAVVMLILSMIIILAQ
jgi:hypothetical protein